MAVVAAAVMEEGGEGSSGDQVGPSRDSLDAQCFADLVRGAGPGG
jgi:hypothetical protein